VWSRDITLAAICVKHRQLFLATPIAESLEKPTRILHFHPLADLSLLKNSPAGTGLSWLKNNLGFNCAVIHSSTKYNGT
jgi:hypothetical protein